MRRRIVVGGAGIGGLAAALALAQRNIDVRVVERRPGLTELGAGIQLAPNATRILDRLGLLATVRARATEPAAIRIRRGRDARDVLRLRLGRDAERRYGAPFVLMHRADLQKVLAEAVQAAGVSLAFGTEATMVAPSGDGVAVSIAGDAGLIAADGYVDAGGVHALRRAGHGGAVPVFTAWRALVPGRDLPSATAPETNLWLGSNAHLVHYPLQDGAVVNVVAITAAVRTREPDADPWSATGDAAHLRQAFAGWHRDATALVDAAPAWRCWPLTAEAPLASWGTGPVTRLGDAAHPMLPFLAQGASQAVEDAGALAVALGDTASVAAAFGLYEQRRLPRAARVQAESRRQGQIYHLGRPAADARDLAMRALGPDRALARLDWLYRPA